MVGVSRKDDRGVHYIAVYKAIKSAAQLVLAVALLIASGKQSLDHLQEHLAVLQQHVSSGWSQHLVALVMKTLTPGHVHLAVAALFVDAILTGIEGYSLHTRKIWGEWLVVVATGSLIPVEAYELVLKPRAVRLLVLLVNIAVVAYLARRKWRRHQAAKAARSSLPAKADSQPGPHLERPMQSVAADTGD